MHCMTTLSDHPPILPGDMAHTWQRAKCVHVTIPGALMITLVSLSFFLCAMRMSHQEEK